MLTLGRLLTSALAPKRRAKADPAYTAFRHLARQHGLTYRVTRDGYIEVDPTALWPRGLMTAHYDWTETETRVRYALARPGAVDADGYYTE